MTAFDDDIASLRESAERIGNALMTISMRVLTDPAVLRANERLQRELRQARAVGQLAVLSLAARLRESEPAPAPAPEPPAPATEPLTPPRCIPNYVDLTASQIVPLMRDLTAAERDEVRRFERATRGRKTILAAARSTAE